MTVPVAWVASLLTALEPSASWSSTYEKTATAIAHASETDSLYATGDEGEARTAAILVSLAWFESRLKPDAVSKDKRSVCLYQVNRSYFADAKLALTDPELCTKTALKVLHRSLEVCRSRAPNDRLAFYMSGQCDRGGADSRYRMFLATKLLKEHPVPPSPPATSAPPAPPPPASPDATAPARGQRRADRG